MNTYLRQFRVGLEEIPTIVADLAEGLRAAGLPRDPQLKAELVLEELLANAAHYGYRLAAPGTEPLVWLSIERHDDLVTIIYQDQAIAYDPLQPAADLELRVTQQHQIGGLGCLLVASLPDIIEYAHVDGRNTLRIGFRTSPPA
jgi:anti-sigma regulatory factor (Ser/Thr protein kinase)